MFAPGIVALALALPMQQPCSSSPPEVVDQIYKQVLERPADQGSAGFSYALGYGEMTVRDIVVTVAQSPEHLTRFFWGPLVNNVYRQTLNRQPSPDEQQAALRQLASGMPIKGFIARTAVGAANNAEQAVRILYQRLLGREPDPDGFRANVALAERNGIDAVVRSMLNSPEYRARAQQPQATRDEVAPYAAGVQMLFRHMLGRAPDPDGLEAMTQLAAVYGLPEVAHRMAMSPEYMQRWGDQGVPGSGVRFCGGGEGRERGRAIPRSRIPPN